MTLDSIFEFAGVNTLHYTADLGDMSKNEEEKCFCPTPDTCLTRNLYDMTKCVGAPIIGSPPHFYDCEKNWLDLVDGLHPNQVKTTKVKNMQISIINEYKKKMQICH